MCWSFWKFQMQKICIAFYGILPLEIIKTQLQLLHFWHNVEKIHQKAFKISESRRLAKLSPIKNSNCYLLLYSPRIQKQLKQMKSFCKEHYSTIILYFYIQNADLRRNFSKHLLYTSLNKENVYIHRTVVKIAIILFKKSLIW